MGTANDRDKAAKHSEIARRYKWARRQGVRVSMASLRVYELTNLFHARYGRELPDDDAGRDDARVMVHHLGALSGDPRRRITPWLRQWCPWLSLAEAEELLIEAITRPQRWRADKLAWRMRLTAADRSALRITTIGAIDMSRAERARRRKLVNTIAKVAARRAKGIKPRAEYLASVLKPRPWEAAGVSRATWYRGQRKPPAPS